MPAPDIFSAEFASNPYPFYKVMRDEYPVYLFEPMNSWVVSRYADVAEAFKNPVFSSRNYDWQLEPVHGRTILQMEGREHSTHRSLVTPAFRGRDLQDKFVPVIEKNAQELIERFRMSGHVELVGEFATHFPISVIVDMLGLPRSDHDKFHAWYTSIMAFLSNLTMDPEVIEQGLRTKAELEEYMVPIIQERRAHPGDDLLSVLCTAEVDGVRMTDLEVKAFVSLLLTAGGETTDKAVASCMKNLVEHPDQMAAVAADRSLVDNVFAETLRYSPPVHMIMRTPDEDVELSGGTVPKDATVTCLIGAAGRDERRYSRPDEFDIFREDLDVSRAFNGAADHVAFCLGRHFCVGAVLARTEVSTAINKLLDVGKDWRLADGFVATEEGVFTRAPKRLELAFTPV